ncbi:MAG: hypothetical protein ACK5XN_38730, partial [Bacteroidota bacterium]
WTPKSSKNRASFREISGWLTRKPGKTGQFSLTATSFLLLFGSHAVGRWRIWPLSRVTVGEVLWFSVKKRELSWEHDGAVTWLKKTEIREVDFPTTQ